MSILSVLFYRDIRASGGHQKVYDYFQHLNSRSGVKPSIAFSDDSLWDESNPWFPDYQAKTIDFQPSSYDCLFLAGIDWRTYRLSGIDSDLPVV